MKIKFILALVLAFSLLFSGCANTDASSKPIQNPSAPVAAEKTLILNGSVAALPLMLDLSDGFHASAQSTAQFAATAVGKSMALEAIASGEAELAMFEGNPDDLPESTKGKPIAYEAIAVIVNPSCGVKNLTSQQITAIFTGESDLWSDFGGNGKITLVLPEKSDVFRQFFEETFAIRTSENGIMQSLVPETAVISTDTAATVLSTAGAIGICPAPSLEDTANEVSIDGIALSEATLVDGAYAGSQVILLLIAKDASQDSQDFFAYCTSDKAIPILQKTGYIPFK